MCGVSGIISLNHSILDRDDQEVIRDMSSLLTHRGPNQRGHFYDDNLLFGNTRLSILDKSKSADLPIMTDEKDIILCYNGEISNYIELSEKYNLKSKYSLKTHSDSEVLLYLYKEIGMKLLDEISGMFAFAIFDKNLNKVFICRDFFGITPLFYTTKNEKFYFASEIKSLLEIPGFERQVNPLALFDYFTLAYVPGENTMFQDIIELRNGQMLTIDLATGNIDKKYHYRMKYEINPDISFKEATDNVYDLLLDSVDRNLRSDAPIGTTLSGGVDTSGITCLIKDLGRSTDFHSFSIRMGESSFDESPYQRLVSDHCKTNHHEFLITPSEVESVFHEHIAHLDEPLGNGAPIPIYILAQRASKYVSVLLNGEGGDEVFNAYSVYQAWKIRKHYVNYCPKFLRQLIYQVVHLLPANYSKLSFDFQAKRFTEGAELHPAAAHFYWRHPLTNSEKKKMLTHSNFRSTDEIGINLFNEFSHTDELNRIAMLDIEHFITDDLLVKNDRMCYAHSIEGRYPYLDKKLIDYVQTLPTEYKLKGLKGRYIQKKALSRTLPKEILKRQNYGLEMPHSIWFFDALKPLLDRYLNKESVERTGFLRWEMVKSLMDTHMSNKRDYGRGLWCIAVFIAWHELYIQTSDYKKYLNRIKV